MSRGHNKETKGDLKAGQMKEQRQQELQPNDRSWGHLSRMEGDPHRRWVLPPE